MLAFTAVTGYLACLPISVVMMAVAWWMWDPGNQRASLALAAGRLAVGAVIHFLPHTADGGMDGLGLPRVVVAAVVQGYLSVRLVRREAGQAVARDD